MHTLIIYLSGNCIFMQAIFLYDELFHFMFSFCGDACLVLPQIT